MGKGGGSATLGAVTLSAQANPAPWPVKKSRTCQHSCEIDNQWPTDIYHVDIYVRTRFGLVSPQGTHIFYTKIRSGQRSPPRPHNFQPTTLAIAGNIEEVNTTASFQDWNGGNYNVHVTYDLDMV